LYINDLPNVVQGSLILFADETCLQLSHKNSIILQNKLFEEAYLLYEWYKSNKLTINPQKCHVLAISPKLHENVVDFKVILNGTNINTKDKIKYLGILVDSSLNFHNQQKLSIINKLKFVLPKKALLKIYYSLIHPYRLYGLVAWDFTFPTYLV